MLNWVTLEVTVEVRNAFESKESLEQKQRSLNRQYKALMKQSEADPVPPDLHPRLSRLRNEINNVDKALKAFR